MQNYLLSSLHVICFKVHSITRDSSISDMLPCFSDEYPKSYTVRIDLGGRKTWVAALHCVSITEMLVMHKFRWVSLHWSEHNKIICNKRSRAKYCRCDSNPQNTQTSPLRVLADCWSIKEATDRLTDRLVIAELANTTTLAAAIHCPLLDLSTTGDRRWWEKADTKNTKSEN